MSDKVFGVRAKIYIGGGVYSFHSQCAMVLGYLCGLDWIAMIDKVSLSGKEVRWYVFNPLCCNGVLI